MSRFDPPSPSPSPSSPPSPSTSHATPSDLSRILSLLSPTDQSAFLHSKSAFSNSILGSMAVGNLIGLGVFWKRSGTRNWYIGKWLGRWGVAYKPFPVATRTRAGTGKVNEPQVIDEAGNGIGGSSEAGAGPEKLMRENWARRARLFGYLGVGGVLGQMVGVGIGYNRATSVMTREGNIDVIRSAMSQVLEENQQQAQQPQLGSAEEVLRRNREAVTTRERDRMGIERERERWEEGGREGEDLSPSFPDRDLYQSSNPTSTRRSPLSFDDDLSPPSSRSNTTNASNKDDPWATLRANSSAQPSSWDRIRESAARDGGYVPPLTRKGIEEDEDAKAAEGGREEEEEKLMSDRRGGGEREREKERRRREFQEMVERERRGDD